MRRPPPRAFHPRVLKVVNFPVMPQLTYLEAIRQGIWEEMEQDPTVFCIGEDIGIYGGAFKITDGFIDRFGPERVIDTPIAESAIVGAAFGASLTGMRPVAEFQFMDFIGCAFNQISNMVAKTHYLWGAPAPLVLRGPSGGYVHGGPFHSQNPEMWFVHNPGLKVICPATPYDAKGLIKAAILNGEAFDDLDGPIVRIAGLDSAVPFSPPQEHHYLPKVEDVVREARRLKAY